jgi:tritrans,polycis-undecaprenyl-diphosphate synthase [geranylgeranyl-diphosphate specific]
MDIPKHIGLILDGNRRFSKKLMKEPWKGHEYGAKKIEELLEWSNELGIKELTLFCFSIENFNRPKIEFDYLMNLFRKEIPRLIDDERIIKNKIKVNFIGRINLFPKDIYDKMIETMEKTKNYNNFKLNFAMAYGGRAEIIDAVKKITNEIKTGKISLEDINEELFKKYLYIESEPDLIIRTSGEKRFSGFMLWQASYSELYFCDKLWPEFTKEDFIEAIENYKKRDRRFGN